MDDPEDRPTVEELMTHKFFTEVNNEDDLKSFKINTEFINSRLYQTQKSRTDKDMLSNKFLHKGFKQI